MRFVFAALLAAMASSVEVPEQDLMSIPEDMQVEVDAFAEGRIDWCDVNLEGLSSVDANKDGNLQFSELRAALKGTGMKDRRVSKILLFMHALYPDADCHITSDQAKQFITTQCAIKKYREQRRARRGARRAARAQKN